MDGQVLDGRYRLEAEIARGAIGVVWRAVDATTGEPVAVKLLRPEAAAATDLVTGFLAEAEILAGLDHPGIVRVRNLITADGVMALVMDLVPGADLRRRLRAGGPLPRGRGRRDRGAGRRRARLHPRAGHHARRRQARQPAASRRRRPGAPGRLRRGPARRPAGRADAGHPGVRGAGGRRRRPADPGRRRVRARHRHLRASLRPQPVPRRPAERRAAPARRLRPGAAAGMPTPLWEIADACIQLDPRMRPAPATVAARLRAVEPALAEHPALVPLPAAAVTHWPRSAEVTAPMTGGAAAGGLGAARRRARIAGRHRRRPVRGRARRPRRGDRCQRPDGLGPHGRRPHRPGARSGRSGHRAHGRPLRPGRRADRGPAGLPGRGADRGPAGGADRGSDRGSADGAD